MLSSLYKNCPYLFDAQIICYNLIYVFIVNKVQEINYALESINFWYDVSSYCLGPVQNQIAQLDSYNACY
jgi:hypothetical protein